MIHSDPSASAPEVLTPSLPAVQISCNIFSCWGCWAGRTDRWRLLLSIAEYRAWKWRICGPTTLFALVGMRRWRQSQSSSASYEERPTHRHVLPHTKVLEDIDKLLIIETILLLRGAQTGIDQSQTLSHELKISRPFKALSHNFEEPVWTRHVVGKLQE